ncbi:hypothetical protein I3760_03G179000 [Carya illinoinensis]|nr:hypothetical protein I3760_03G179000 [Carya illinoinensis]
MVVATFERASSSSSPCPCFLQILGFALADNSKYTLHPQLLHSFLLRPPSYSVAIAFPFSSSFDRLLHKVLAVITITMAMIGVVIGTLCNV